MKKFLCVLCASVLIFGCGTGVMAAETDLTAEPEITVGKIIEETEGQIKVSQQDDEESVVVLNITADTVIVDANTGMSTGLDNRESEFVKVYYGPTQTMSMPPISNALIIAVNRPEDKFAPNYTVVEDIKIEDGTAYITSFDGSSVISVNEDATVIPYLTKNIVTIDDIKIGSELLLWDELSLLSFPSQSSSDLVVILSTPAGEEPEPEAEAPEIQAPAAEEPEIPAPAEVNMKTEATLFNGVEMYSVPAEIEALGGTVSSYFGYMIVTYGEDAAVITSDMTVFENGHEISLSSKPVAVDGTLYAVKDFFKIFK